MPAAVIGLMAHGYIKSVLFSPVIVSVMLIVGGATILMIERIKPATTIHDVDSMTPRHALWVGFAQALAMIPGTSRSGATMMGALLMGIDRRAAAEFSFLLAIPTMSAATAYDLYRNYSAMSMDDAQIIAAGFISAFIAALLTVRWLLHFLSSHGFAPFAYYRIILGAMMLLML